MPRKPERVLVVDDEDNLRRVLSREIAAMGYAVGEARDADAALVALEGDEAGLVLLDYKLPGRDGLDLLGELRQRWPRTEVIMMTGHGSVETAIAAMKAGAYDFLQKPCHLDELEQLIAKALERRALVVRAERAEALADSSVLPPSQIEWGASPAMARVRSDLHKVAPTDVPVLVLGESGTGKELVARELHALSEVKAGPFVPVNCGAIAPSLVESLLFGHEKGAFTGADKRKLGLVEAADGGTLFLDELGDIPLETQAKLLRVLESKTFEPVGGNRTVTSDFRLVAATNQNIEEMIREKTFREELWMRMNVIRIELPALRERRADIPLLVEKFMADTSERYRKAIEGVSPAAMQALTRYPYEHGNIRELRNVVERLVILANGPVIELRDLPRELRGAEAAAGEVEGAALAGRSMDDIEREAIRQTLELTEGNRKQAAQMLQIGERTLYRKIEKYGL